MYIFAASGGGLNGAHHGGVLEALNESGVIIDSVVGISTGALAAGWMSQFEPTMMEQRQGIINFKKIWFELEERADVLDFSILKAIWRLITLQPSVGNLHPLEIKIRKYITKVPKIPCGIGIVSIKDGTYKTVYPTTVKELQDAMIASCTMPGYAPPVSKEAFMDGGLKHVSGLSATFDLIRKHNFKNVNIISSDCWNWPAPDDVTVAEDKNIYKKPIWAILLRCQNVVSRYAASSDIWTSELINETCTLLDNNNIPRPEKLLNKVIANIIPIRGTWGYDTFEVNHTKIIERWNRGYKLAMEKINII